MKEYPKIQNVFLRSVETGLLTPTIKVQEVTCIDKWVATEKIDGTNIRVDFRHSPTEGESLLTIGGRTSKAQLNGELVNRLCELLPLSKLASIVPEGWEGAHSVTLFGEGYGAGIQKGGGYSSVKDFALFDVLVNDRVWLGEEAVTDMAEELGITRAPVYHYAMTLLAAIQVVTGGFFSLIPGATCKAEGLVLKPKHPLADAHGNRVIVKLKTKDFEAAGPLEGVLF